MLKSSDRTYDDTPTFRQYCKRYTGFEKPVTKVVQKLWLPNQYPSVSLHTESYRLRIHKKSDIYEELLESIDNWEKAEACIAICLLNPKTLEFEIIELANEGCSWTLLGDFGYELAVLDRKPTSKRPKAAT